MRDAAELLQPKRGNIVITEVSRAVEGKDRDGSEASFQAATSIIVELPQVLQPET